MSDHDIITFHSLGLFTLHSIIHGIRTFHTSWPPFLTTILHSIIHGIRTFHPSWPPFLTNTLLNDHPSWPSPSPSHAPLTLTPLTTHPYSTHTYSTHAQQMSVYSPTTPPFTPRYMVMVMAMVPFARDWINGEQALWIRNGSIHHCHTIPLPSYIPPWFSSSTLPSLPLSSSLYPGWPQPANLYPARLPQFVGCKFLQLLKWSWIMTWIAFPS